MKTFYLVWEYIGLVILGISFDIARNIGTLGTPQQWHPQVWHFLAPFVIVVIPYLLSLKKVQKALGIRRSKAQSPVYILFSGCLSFGLGIILAHFSLGGLTPWFAIEISLLSLAIFAFAYFLILYKKQDS